MYSFISFRRGGRLSRQGSVGTRPFCARSDGDSSTKDLTRGVVRDSVYQITDGIFARCLTACMRIDELLKRSKIISRFEK